MHDHLVIQLAVKYKLLLVNRGGEEHLVSVSAWESTMLFLKYQWSVIYSFYENYHFEQFIDLKISTRGGKIVAQDYSLGTNFLPFCYIRSQWALPAS